jgi:phosphatidylinositol alpha-1,6-mannosyltransferase
LADDFPASVLREGVFLVLLLATEIWRNPGGIQRYMKMLVTIMGMSADPPNIVTLLDRESDLPIGVSGGSVRCCEGAKWRFCLEVLRLVKSGRIHTAIVGHVALLPVAWLFWRLGWIQNYAVVLHGMEAWQRLPWVSRIAARNAAVVIATTHYTAREFCFHNDLAHVKHVVIPLACTIRGLQRPQRMARQLRLLTVTRLSSFDVYKGVDTILLAVRRGRELGLNLSLEVIGDGDDRERLEGMSRVLDIRDAVRFRGSVSDVLLQEALRESHVFVLPSKKEGFGIAFLEAMASGLPCIGGNHGGVPEVIEHSESGFLIEYGDVEHMVFLLRALMESDALISEVSREARRRAETFGFDAMAQSWQSLLRSLQAQQPAADGRVGAGRASTASS